MTFDEYQKQAGTTSTIDPKSVTAPYYFALGLNGEAGEVAEKLKKIIRNHNNDLSKLDAEDFPFKPCIANPAGNLYQLFDSGDQCPQLEEEKSNLMRSFRRQQEQHRANNMFVH